MSEAIFGLVGVVIGGALNLVGLWVLDRRRDQRGTQTAARLLIPDLQECYNALWLAQGDSAWSAAVMPDTRWKDQEERLARGVVNANDWNKIMETFRSIDVVANEEEVHPPGAVFTAEDKAFIQGTYEAVPATLDVLRRYAGLTRRQVNVKRRP